VNSLGVLKGTGGGKSLLWNGHYDTVPVGNLNYWTVDPFGAEVKDGKIYGRGSGDMKGAISSAIIAAKALDNMGFELRGDLHFHAVADEEFFGRTSDRTSLAPTQIRFRPYDGAHRDWLLLPGSRQGVSLRYSSRNWPWMSPSHCPMDT